MSDSGEAKMCEEELESQRAEEESQSQQRQVAEISNKSSEKVARTEDDEALPLACPICKTSFLDPAVTNCDHYFCKRYALKHHENDTNCFVCKKPTLGVFKPSVELKNKVATVLENAQHQLKSQPTEEESQSQHSERANKRKLDEDSEQVARAEDDDDALPLACPSCKLSFLDPACLDPVVTTCDHYFCNLCALKHHKNDATCFVCKKPTLGVFKPSVEIKNKIAKVRENLKPQGLYVSQRITFSSLSVVRTVLAWTVMTAWTVAVNGEEFCQQLRLTNPISFFYKYMHVVKRQRHPKIRKQREQEKRGRR